MSRVVSIAVVSSLTLLAQSYAQEVFVPRDASAGPAVTVQREKAPKEQILKAEPVKPPVVAKTQPVSAPVKEPAPPVVVKTQPVSAPVKEPAPPVVAKAQPVSAPVKEPAPPVVAKAQPVSAPVKEPAPPVVVKTQPVSAPVKEPAPPVVAKAQPVSAPVKEPAIALAAKPPPAKVQPAVVETKVQPLKVAMVKAQQLAQPSRFLSGSVDTAYTKLADGFDFAIGKPDAQGYYKARGFRSKGHLGEDWDGVGGGDTDRGDPIYSIGDGIVVFARDCHMGWGNVIIVRHTYREGGDIKHIDALYGHLHTMLVKRGQSVARGQQIATMGTAHGLYDAHLHLEIRKNLEIGMSRAKFARDFSNYYDPTQFIQAHRHLQTNEGRYKIAMNTFTYDSKINWATKRNYSGYRGGGSESARALKKAVASQGR